MLYIGGAWFSGFLCGKGNETSMIAAGITFIIGTIYLMEET
jgi:hypothetical protein